MRAFLYRTSIAVALAALVHVIAAFFADGRFDDHYLRFTGAPRSSLIIGTSRAAQCLLPDVMNPMLDRAGAHGDLFNFAFTIAHSPFGPTYLDAIRGKLDANTKNGTFLVTVDPWSLSVNKDLSAATTVPPEKDRTLGQQWFYNGTPNFEYLLRHAPTGWGAFMGRVGVTSFTGNIRRRGALRLSLCGAPARRARRSSPAPSSARRRR